MLKEQKFHLDGKQAKFLDRYREYGFKNKNELITTALQRLQSELEAKELQESTELYAETYREDKELQELTESVIEIEGKNMINSKIEKQIIGLLKKMNEQQQQELLNFARFLTTTKPVGVPGKDLLKFGGTIPKEELEEMAKAIEEEFGRVD